MTASLKSPFALRQLSGMNAAQWTQLGNQRAPQLVAGLAVLGIAWQAAKLTWLFLSPAATVSQAAPIQPSQATSSNQVSPQQLADAHLFGIASANPGITDPNNLPQSQTSLVLAGTMAMEDPEAGYAIVGDNAASAKFYRVGATLNGNVRLHSVYADRVIIDRNGTLETLVLPRGLPSSATVPTVRTASTNSVGDNLRRIVSNNPSALGELLRAQPVFSNGVQKGYRVYPGRDRQQFTRLGLQPGDLVTSINGSTLDDVNRSAEILNTLTSSTTATVVVERNGLSNQLTLDMAQLSLPDSASTDNANSTSNDSSDSSNGAALRNAGFNGPPSANRSSRSGRNSGSGTPSTQ